MTGIPLDASAELRAWLDSLRDWVGYATEHPSPQSWGEARQALGCVECLTRQIPECERPAIVAEASEYACAIPPANLDCKACGKCCAPDARLVMVIDLTPEEGARIESLYPGTTRPYKTNERRLAFRFEMDGTTEDAPDAHACCFHRGPEGCGIYTNRPNVCREWRAGCRLCLDIRSRHGLPPEDSPAPQFPP